MTIFYFPQLDHEPLHIYWDRLVSFITQPGCYADIWEICHMIYDGVDYATRATIEGSCRGMFNYMPYEERWELLKLLAQNSEETEMRQMAETMKSMSETMENMMQSLMVQLQKSDQATDASITRLKAQVAQLAANEQAGQPDQIPSPSDNLDNTADAIILDEPVEDEPELILAEVGELGALLHAGEQIPETVATASLTVEDEMEPVLEEAKRIDWYAVEPLEKNTAAAKDITVPPYADKLRFPNQQPSFPRKRYKLKGSFPLVQYASIIPWHYLCFCLAHAQFFDRLLRALSCFDYDHWRVTAF